MSGGWNTIESDAGVFTSLIEALGVEEVQFEELISLDSSYLLSLPQPVYGVIFLFKYPTASNEANDKTATSSSSSPQAIDGTFDTAASENLFFAHQVISNACATQALLSVLLNQGSSIKLGEALSNFRDFTIPLDPAMRGESLSNIELIRTVHNSFARASPFVDEVARPPTAEDEDVYHFIAYTPVNGTLYELDGLQPAPIGHGACEPGMQFAEKVAEVLQKRIQRYGESEIRFNLMAAVKDPRVDARLRGDWDTVEREDRKRREWAWENSLRRHNFLGFTLDILKQVVKQKLDKGEYDQWVKDAVGETTRKVDARRALAKGS